MQNTKWLIGAIGGSLLLIVVVAMLFSREDKPKLYDQAVIMGEARNATASGELVSSVGEATGSAQAETNLVTVVEFSDFECPACKAWSAVVKGLVDQGKIRLVYRHKPLMSIHKSARLAAIAAEAAAVSGKFWEYHDLLFANQEVWSQEADVKAKLVEYAVSLGIDEQKFLSAMESEAVKGKVAADEVDANKLAIDSTPTFFIDGEKLNGDQMTERVR